MCQICLDIMKGKYSNAHQLQKDIDHARDFAGMSLAHSSEVFDEYMKYIKSKPRESVFEVFNTPCSCGAKHTSFPTKHLKYCSKHKE